ncbi:hypothetical protein D3C84_1217620 [compost metagenome]
MLSSGRAARARRAASRTLASAASSGESQIIATRGTIPRASAESALCRAISAKSLASGSGFTAQSP